MRAQRSTTMGLHPIITQGGGIRIYGEARLIDCNINENTAENVHSA